MARKRDFMRIAVASTGLGHVCRGIETSAIEMARNFSQSAPGIKITLFGAAEINNPGLHPASRKSFAGTRPASPKGCAETRAFKYRIIPCLKRGDKLVRLWARIAPGFTWRWGWKAPYVIEQKSFAKRLIRILRQHEHDLVYTQDPDLALELQRAKNRGLIETPIILGHGTADSLGYLKGIVYLQHLCLTYREKWVDVKKCEMRGDYWISPEGQYQFCIPNFVDTKKFTPVRKEMNRPRDPALDAQDPTDKKAEITRESFGIPQDSLVLGCSAALKFSHKRLDYLIREVAELQSCRVASGVAEELCRDEGEKREIFLLLAGAVTDETPQVEKLAKEKLGDHCKILKNVPLDQMPDFYRALDIYIHPSYDEFYGFAIIEAMACGLPVIAYMSPSLNEQVYDEKYLDLDAPAGGVAVDMKAEGALKKFLEELNHGDTENWIKRFGRQARERAEKLFSWEAVEPRFIRMYEEVMADNKKSVTKGNEGN